MRRHKKRYIQEDDFIMRLFFSKKKEILCIVDGYPFYFF